MILTMSLGVLRLLSEENLKRIANIFIGDTEEFYAAKTDPMLVDFFADNFQFNDSYQKGFPSRWVYTVDSLKILWDQGRIDEFLSLILSHGYIQKEFGCSKVEAILKADKIYSEFRKVVATNGYTITHIGDRYKLVLEDDDLVLIGSGGFANVYKQKSTGLVVKKLKDELIADDGVRSRFKREFDIAKSIQDIEGIIKVYEYNADDCSYTMEIADTTLAKYCTSRDLDDNVKIAYMQTILSIMGRVHDRDIIHRDLSPSNIFLIHGRLKIADFGLGKDMDAIVSHQTMTTKAVGQYSYCAPEQFVLLKGTDKKSDVYALGRVLNFIMTGNPDNIHHDFQVVATKATSHDPERRYADAGEMLDFFEKAVKYNENINLKDKALSDIHQGQWSNVTEVFIQRLSEKELCLYLIKHERGFMDALLDYMMQNDDYALDIMGKIDDAYDATCQKFEEYDTFAKLAYRVAGGKYSYSSKEVACNILRNIAIYVNRFYAQRLVSDLLENGVEPSLEEILQS